MQQTLISRRSIGFFTSIHRAVFYSIGFIVFLSLYSIFHKLSFQSISLVYRLMFLAFFYGYIGPKLFMGDLARPLLIS